MDIDITLNGLLLGALAIAIGLAFAFWGFRVFLVLLPIWGFFAGFLLGAQGVQYIFGDAFLSEITSWVVGFLLGANGVEYIFGDAFLATATGWVVGFLLGLLFAVLAYLYYFVAVILLGGALGYQLTIGLLQWIGFDADGIIAFLLAIAGGVIFAVGFFVLRMPAVLVIVVTAIVGAATAIAGVAVGLGILPYQELSGGIFGIHAASDVGWLGIIAAIALAFAGAIYQTRTVADMSAAITGDAYMNPGLDDQSRWAT